MFASFPEVISKGPLDFLDFRPPKAAEMRGTLQKQQIRAFRNVRSFSGSHFQGALDFLDFRPPKAAEMRGTLQKQQNRPFRNVRSFSGSHFQGPLIFVISGR